MKKLLLLMLLAPSLAWGQSVVYDGQSFRQSLQFMPTGGIVRADSTGRMQTMDASGVSFTTEMYPPQFQETGLTIVSALALTTNQANSSNPLTGAGLTPASFTSIYAEKWVRVLVTGAPTNSPPWSIRFYGSPDGLTYAPLLRSFPGTNSGSGATPPVAQATDLFIGQAGQLDTLKIRGRGPMTGNGLWIPLIGRDGERVVAKNITAVCSADSILAAANYTFTVEIRGRQ